jgi:hypothetical protein
MNKKDYEKPTMRVVKLQHTGMLMTSAQQGVKSERHGYGAADEQTWE